jgi:hypothetical protein
MPGLTPGNGLLTHRELLALPARRHLAVVHLSLAYGKRGVPFPARLLPKPQLLRATSHRSLCGKGGPVAISCLLALFVFSAPHKKKP